MTYQQFRKVLLENMDVNMCKSTLSSSLETEYGVMEGSVVGSSVFILYVNDLPFCVESN